jgi:hypothetical protein
VACQTPLQMSCLRQSPPPKKISQSFRHWLYQSIGYFRKLENIAILYVDSACFHLSFIYLLIYLFTSRGGARPLWSMNGPSWDSCSYWHIDIIGTASNTLARINLHRLLQACGMQPRKLRMQSVAKLFSRKGGFPVLARNSSQLAASACI